MGSGAPWVQVGAVALASYTTGDLNRDRIRAAVLVLVVAASISAALLAQDAAVFQAVVIPFVVVVPAWLLGDIVRQRRLEAVARAEAGERALRDAEERVRAAVAEERRTMARELHDVVAHGVSVMLIQAGAARQVVATSPEQATDALLTVEATGREAMSELRRLLGVLDDDGEGAGVAPQPGLAQLGLLLDRVREAGLPAQLEVAGTPRALPPSLDVTAYRIVQEALTNALRYARRAATLVRLTWEPAQLRVEILDDGPAAAEPGGDGSGRGLVGMHERAARVGGRLEAGPRLGGGYAVRAWLPLAAEGS
jgi:signal transduction histidine kinase